MWLQSVRISFSLFCVAADAAVLSQCNFDVGQTCSFIQDTGIDSFDWTQGSGRAGGAGISADRSQGNSAGQSRRPTDTGNRAEGEAERVGMVAQKESEERGKGEFARGV